MFLFEFVPKSISAYYSYIKNLMTVDQWRHLLVCGEKDRPAEAIKSAYGNSSEFIRFDRRRALSCVIRSAAKHSSRGNICILPPRVSVWITDSWPYFFLFLIPRLLNRKSWKKNYYIAESCCAIQFPDWLVLEFQWIDLKINHSNEREFVRRQHNDWNGLFL